MAKILTNKTGQGRLGYYHTKIEDESTGMTKYGMRLFINDKLDAQYINEWASIFTGTSEAQMEIAFAALAKAIQYFTLNGHSLTLKDLGCFFFSTKSGVYNEQLEKWQSAGKESMEAVSSDDIRALYIRFRPTGALRTAIGTSEFFNAVATVQGWKKLTNNKAVADAPTITVSGRNFRIEANANDPCGTPLSYSLDSGVTWQAYTGRVNVPGSQSVTIKARATGGNGKHSEISTATMPAS